MDNLIDVLAAQNKRILTLQLLLEAVLIQRALDAIDGIDITHPSRQYSETITKDKQPGRNERVMLQGPAGEMEFVKSKKVDSYLQKGWNLI